MKNNLNLISAKIIADSITPKGERLTTLEVVMPRYILAEFNTHRMLSKNSASSRAIPVRKMIKSVQETPFVPYAWQKEHTGMQGTEYITDESVLDMLVSNHLKARDEAVVRVELETNLGATKQNANRKLEPFMYHKVLVSATEWENFFNLRCPQYVLPRATSVNVLFKSWKDVIQQDKENTSDNPYHVDRISGEKFLNNFTILQRLQQNKGQADIHMMFLAESIYDAMNESTPNKLGEGDWHIPYGDNFDEDKIDTLAWKTCDHKEETYKEFHDSPRYNKFISEIKSKISIARCARLSYQTLGDNPVIDYEADLKLYGILSKSGHWSPFEHVAKVMTDDEYYDWYKGNRNDFKTLERTNNNTIHTVLGWCRNYKGFIQYRELLD